MAKIHDLTLLSDIFPTGYHGAVTAGVGPGSIVYVAGAGPVGLACAAACHLLGAAVVIVGDMIPERLAQARSFGCETVDLEERRFPRRADRANHRRPGSRLRRRLRRLRSARPWTRCRRGASRHRAEFADGRSPAPAARLGIPGLYVTDDPGGVDDAAKTGNLSIRIGLGWAKSHTLRNRPMPGHALSPPADAGDSARQDSDGQGRQRHGDFAR